jgi:hypothetical protein
VDRAGDTPPGCLTIPLLIVMVPLRLVWEVLAAIGRFARAYVVRPIGWLLYNGLVRPLRWVLLVLVLRPLWWALRYLVAFPLWWLLRTFVLLPARWVFERVLVPLWAAVVAYALRPLWAGFVWLVRVVAIPLAWTARWIGRGLAALWRVVLRPLLTALGRLVAYTWRLAGVVLFHLLVRPVRFLWRAVLRPLLRALAHAWRATVVRAARWTRVHVWEPTRAAGRSVSRALGLAARRP